MSGEMKLAGVPDKPPLQKGGHFAQVHGGLAWIRRRDGGADRPENDGRGQFVDVSIAEAWTSIAGAALKRQTYTGEVPNRVEPKAEVPGGLRRSADGWVIVGGRGGNRDCGRRLRRWWTDLN